MAWPYVFSTMPAGNVPASDIDANFNAAVFGATTSVAGTIAQFADTSGKVLSNGTLTVASLTGQLVSTITGAVATGTTVIPFDNTIPQNTEGDQYMSLAIVPAASTSLLLITVTVFLSNDNASGNNLIASLFQDSNANALAAGAVYNVTQGAIECVTFNWVQVSGTTLTTTFKVRAGGQAAGTTTFNGTAAARIFGGVMASSITIREIIQ